MPAAASPLVKRLAFWSIPIAFAVMGMKLVAWYVTGSIALLSDGLESTVNVIAALVAYFAVSYAQKPADAEHQGGQRQQIPQDHPLHCAEGRVELLDQGG